MRTLNRPMFNMGGPIKQGIMHGIREPYRGGGQAALVGNPVYPRTGGREHHNIGKTIFGNVGNILKGAKPLWQRIKPTRIPKTRPIRSKTMGGVQLTEAQRAAGMGTETIPGMERAGKWVRTNPWWTAAGAVGATSDAPVAVVKGVPGALKWGAEALTPGWAEKYLPWADDTTDLVTQQKEIVTGGAGGEGVVTKDTSTTESRAAFAKKQQNERVNKYLDLMGYDASRHDAVSKALIDASKIVSDRGTLDRKNITAELINPAIQALSKRLEKPAQIREAVGLMMTKADLEKEMYQSKPGTQLKAAQDYVSEFGGSMANAYKQLGLTKKGDFTESLGALSKQYGSKFDNQKVIIENIKFQKSNEPGFDIESIKVLGDADKLEEIKKQENFVSVSDAILRNPEAHKEIDGQLVPVPGIYVLGSTVLEVFEDGTHKRLN